MKELTPMQAASWVGRRSGQHLGGVAAHLYAEFDGAGLDIHRLERAVGRLYQHHPMLRLRITPEGRQTIAPLDERRHRLRIDDWRDAAPPDGARYLDAKRRSLSTQRLALEQGQASDISVSLLPDDRCRLHVDVDMIAADAPSFRILLEELARFYHRPPAAADAADAAYFRYLDRMRADESLQRRYRRDKRWWRQRLADIPPAPPLPQNGAAGECRSDRLAARLTPAERRSLEKTARARHLTLTTLFLCAFAGVLASSNGVTRFRLNVPIFHRPPYVDGVERIIGDFSDLTILDVEYSPGASLAAFCRQTAPRLAQLLSHSHYPGVNVLRDLSRRHGGVQLAPVVFTSGLGLPGGRLFSDAVLQTFGEMNWVISQGPQVALDVQAVDVHDGVLLNWDIRLDCFPQPAVGRLFERYLNLLRRLARSPEALHQPLERLYGEEQALPRPVRENIARTPLTALQQAYLVGRSEQWPLGGVAMQDFREYRGNFPVAVLRKRLSELVRRHPALRTRIDADTLSQRVSPDVVVNMDEIDLRALPRADALRRADEMRRACSHARNDLALAPWHIWIIELALGDGRADEDFTTLAFTSFDALIMDGASISAILAQLFAATEIAPPAVAQADDGRAPIPAAQRREDEGYWREKLRDFPPPPALPWKRPLASIPSSGWRRESVTLPRGLLKKISAIGARHGLFQNAILSAAILDTLSLWNRDDALAVGVPVAFPATDGRLGNASTFVALRFAREPEDFFAAARRWQQDTLAALHHLTFSGVDLTRLLLQRHGQSPALPVILTNGLAWETPPAGAPMRFHAGLTQTPQVAMDIRLLRDRHRDLLLAADYAERALDRTVVRDMLRAMARRIALLDDRAEPAPPPGRFIDYRHYRRNGDEGDFIGSGFLARLAAHLFDSPPDKAAVRCGDRTISYAELGRSVATAMANLRRHGMAPGKVAALVLPRSPQHLTIALACALQGIVWLPVDTGSPPQRMAYLLTNCRPDLVVGDVRVGEIAAVSPQTLLSPVAQQEPAPSRAELSERSHSSDPAYYLYTSGTTGKPKCVVLSYRATDNTIGQTLKKWNVGRRDVFISVTPPHHDMSLFDLFGSLCAGATLVLPAPDEEKDAIAWNRLIERHRVTLWCSVPAILEMLLSCTRGEQLGSLRLIAQGGDYIKPATVRALRERLAAVRLFSLGGPTETTIWSIWHEISAEDSDVIPYGRPLPANRYFICHDTGEHCPAYVVGRIYTAGVNLALGYLENGVLEQHDFVTLKDAEGKPLRAFRTGDRGYYRQDGDIIFAGRVDGYVKVRGVRVSLPEIEAALAKHPAIDAAAVVDYATGETGEIALGAMYTSRYGAEIPIAELRAFVGRYLPDTHVPTRMVHAEALPLSANGKTDRRRIRLSFSAAAPAPVSAPGPAD
ncbi:amino acid adenylation domain-containing protein [Brenneria tiliae]|uniref:amino acid adenylation domain-containing protein n=1 Tax=Brenneria tiliae TaxID=2914984 RepID=UPI002014E610|nr:amino acid adenylation domain-containing protein [Brenneria tiliae]MCL2897271.1 amino acid adenylation domain-containing protein [Brenneria tiliae]MCL2901786.1 amino acid adenylation domain-containing protein [Brenneria tiliae]